MMNSLTGIVTPENSLPFRKLRDSVEEKGTMVAARDCLLKDKKRKYRDLPGIYYIIESVDPMVLAQKEVEAEKQVVLPRAPLPLGKRLR